MPKEEQDKIKDKNIEMINKILKIICRKNKYSGFLKEI